jgi:hypothetical protein
MTAKQKLRRNQGKLLAEIERTLNGWMETETRLVLTTQVSVALTVGVVGQLDHYCQFTPSEGVFVFFGFDGQFRASISATRHEQASIENGSVILATGPALISLTPVDVLDVHENAFPMGPRLLSPSPKPNGKGPHSGAGR